MVKALSAKGYKSKIKGPKENKIEEFYSETLIVKTTFS